MSFRTVNGTAKTSDNDYIAKTGENDLFFQHAGMTTWVSRTICSKHRSYLTTPGLRRRFEADTEKKGRRMIAPNPIVEADFTLLKRQLPGAGARGARRYRCDLATLCRIVAAQGESGDIAWVHDVSKTGIGLIFAQAAEASTLLTLRLRKTDQNGVITKDVTVVHCTPEVNGSWRIGCVFAQELTDDEIDSCI